MPRRNKKIGCPDGGATDQVGEGLEDITGAEASEMPDKGRGGVETNPGKQLRRRLPGQTGGIIGDDTDVGLAGEPEVGDVRQHGARKPN